MSGYADGGQNPVGRVRDTDDTTRSRAESGLARRALAEQWPAADLAQVAQMLGLRPNDKPATKTDPLGKTVRPEVQQARREREREYKRTARAKQKDAS